MNPKEIQLVQQTFAQIVPIAETAADLFYGRLFLLDPSLRSLFPQTMDKQGSKLMTALAFAVRNLHRPEEILPTVQQIGARHVRYGVQAKHYQTVGEALLWTLGQGLGDNFTQETKAAWAAAYDLLATVMIDAAAAAAVVSEKAELAAAP